MRETERERERGREEREREREREPVCIPFVNVIENNITQVCRSVRLYHSVCVRERGGEREREGRERERERGREGGRASVHRPLSM